MNEQASGSEQGDVNEQGERRSGQGERHAEPPAEGGTGQLWGVGLGPGDPELITVKAARLISSAEVIAYHCARHGRSIARSVAEPYLCGDQHEERLMYPVTTETTDHPGGYEGAIAEFYEQAAKRLACHLDAGRDVVLLCEGDPFFYGSYMHMHERLCDRYTATAVPGVTSVSAAAAEVGRPLVQREEVLTTLPGTLPAPELAMRLAETDAAAVLKLGRTFSSVRDALAEAGKLDQAYYVERATWGVQQVAPMSEVDPESVPYFSVAVLPSPAYAERTATAAVTSATASSAAAVESSTATSSIATSSIAAESSTAEVSSTAGSTAATVDMARVPGEAVATGEVTVVGLGPGDARWLTPEASEVLAEADHLVGYGPYLRRVAPCAGQQRHPSGNRVEVERAAEALELAAAGARVAVVSSGDPGVFAMATAVLEQAGKPCWHGVRVRVVPGVTAAQAAAARVGAPLGHDYCVVSLSDRLKPWEVIERRLDAAGVADMALAIYNPASRSRTSQLAAARDVLLRHRDPATPVVIARDVGGTEESVRITTLGELDPSEVDMRCMLIVGSSTTELVDRGGETTMWTPRWYG